MQIIKGYSFGSYQTRRQELLKELNRIQEEDSRLNQIQQYSGYNFLKTVINILNYFLDILLKLVAPLPSKQDILTSLLFQDILMDIIQTNFLPIQLMEQATLNIPTNNIVMFRIMVITTLITDIATLIMDMAILIIMEADIQIHMLGIYLV